MEEVVLVNLVTFVSLFLEVEEEVEEESIVVFALQSHVHEKEMVKEIYFFSPVESSHSNCPESLEEML